MRKLCAMPYVQYTSNVDKTVCPTVNTTQLRSAVLNMFHNDMEKRNPYQSKSRRRLPEPTPVSVSSLV